MSLKGIAQKMVLRLAGVTATMGQQSSNRGTVGSPVGGLTALLRIALLIEGLT